MMLVVVFFLLLILPILGDGAKQPEPLCADKCGDVDVPYPFGMREGCYLDKEFFINCNSTYNPPKLFLGDRSINVTRISLEGQLHILKKISRICYSRSGDLDLSLYLAKDFWLTKFYVNNTGNKLVVVGCDSYGYINGQRGDKRYTMGCMSICESPAVVNNGSCRGGGCCEASVPEDMMSFNLTVGSFKNHSSVWNFNPCSYALLVESEQFVFTLDNLTNLWNVVKLPAVLDWTAGNETCEMARQNLSSYACQDNSDCRDVKGYLGYRCFCKNGYEGNPYLINGCKDINECGDENLNDCTYKERCKNIAGSYTCSCPKGYYGEGRGQNGCIRRQSNHWVIAASTGPVVGHLILVAIGVWTWRKLKKIKERKQKQKFFKRNGGLLLQQQSSSSGGKVLFELIHFVIGELEKATDKFSESRVLGKGGLGTVYKGMLSDGRIVAVKKANIIDDSQVGQFINEVFILSRINHRNIVKLLGCCLESEVPLLVYEYISNGTLSHHLHNKPNNSTISWKNRLRIAAEVAGAIAYLHFCASTAIYHRDIKSSNILLDENFKVVISDFGLSRSVSVDKTHLTTLVGGTFGYLDPEYFQSGQLNDKSDVYAFGVVLAEILTGQKAVSCTKDDIGLALRFRSAVKEHRLFEIVEEVVAYEGRKEEIVAVAKLAKRCLKINARKRPTMKEVAAELDQLRKTKELPEDDQESFRDKYGLVSEKGSSCRIGSKADDDQIMSETN